MEHWRQDIHMHPELGFEEHAGDLVAKLLAKWGIEVSVGACGGPTAVIGTLRGKTLPTAARPRRPRWPANKGGFGPAVQVCQ